MATLVYEDEFAKPEGWVLCQIENFGQKRSANEKHETGKEPATFLFDAVVIDQLSDKEEEDYTGAKINYIGSTMWLQFMYTRWDAKNEKRIFIKKGLLNTYAFLKDLGIEYMDIGSLENKTDDEIKSAILAILTSKENQIVNDAVGKTLWICTEVVTEQEKMNGKLTGETRDVLHILGWQSIKEGTPTELLHYKKKAKKKDKPAEEFKQSKNADTKTGNFF